jgi:hypothetical protein
MPISRYRFYREQKMESEWPQWKIRILERAMAVFRDVIFSAKDKN